MEINKHDNKIRKRIGIIGAGAAGMTAAIAAARAGAEVTIFERNDRAGRKILMTGNGRCNLGNRILDASMYNSDMPDFVADRLKEFGVEDAISFFNGLGLMLKEKNGYLYPACEQASAVLEVLKNEISALGIELITNCIITGMEKSRHDGKIHLYGDFGENIHADCGIFDSVIVACGGMASPATGSDGNGYKLAMAAGHGINPTAPALVQLKCKDKLFKSVSGVRADAYVSVYQNGRAITGERGELQLTDYGISGIPVFQISRAAAYLLKRSGGGGVEVHINFFPDFSDADYEAFCMSRRLLLADRNVGEFFTGMLNVKLMRTFIRMAGLRDEDSLSAADSDRLDKVFSLCRDLKVTVVDTNSYANAQVTAGGVPLREISDSFESRRLKGLYFAGEILDVDGKCGGYNLHWAWCSGHIAGEAAAGV